MTRPLASLIALTLLVAAGWVHGTWSDRWQKHPALESALARVEQVPIAFGDWLGENLVSEYPEEFEKAGAQAHWMRRYQNTRTGAAFQVILMCGRSGRMSVHTPEVCYRGAGFDLFGQPRAMSAKSPTGETFGELWTAQFSKKNVLGSELKLFWGWNADGRWRAASSPRLEFLGWPFLYKLYVSQDVTGLTTPQAAASAETFLQELLPELQKALFFREP